MTLSASITVLLFILVFVCWLIGRFLLSGKDLSSYDTPLKEAAQQVFGAHPDDPEHNKKIISQLSLAHQEAAEKISIKHGLKVARSFADNLSCNLITDTKFISTKANSVDCEWAVATNANPDNRIVFFHGGAFLFGSTLGHRKFADKLSKLSNAAVLSVNYRLLPRYARSLGIKDAQKAYLWALDNGPNGSKKANFIMVSGDSAGGNLAHMISSWSKKNAPRQPDCIVSFSPSLDQTLSSPSITDHQNSDPILGKGLGLLNRLPTTLKLWLILLSTRYNPANPLASPLFSDLSSLPPTLIHASSSEMLLGESIRYTNKAKSEGSNVTLQVWEDQVHDWHLFNMGYGSANVAWNEVAKFISAIQSDSNA